jgi:hypothetical protein
MDLPDWNEALQQDSFDCSPVKQPLAQVKRAALTPTGGGRQVQAGDSHSTNLGTLFGFSLFAVCTDSQMRLKAGNTQRVSARGHPSGAAAAGGKLTARPGTPC